MSLQYVSFLDFRSNYSKEIDAALESFFASSVLSSAAPSVLKMSQYQLATGGKRIRACLPAWFFSIAGIPATGATPLGVAVELIHNATLVHDDLQDGDEYRRGTATVWKRFGSQQAINCGDALFYFANLALLQFEASAAVKEKLLHHFSSSMLQVIEGQSQEFLMKDETYPTVARYKTVVEGKTSGLFAMPIGAAFLALEQSEAVQKSAMQACAALGVLFQIQDDILDIYGEKGREKKASDISEGKVSYLVAHVFETGSAEQKQSLSAILRKDRQQTTDKDIETALQIFAQTHALHAAAREIQNLKNEIETSTQEMPAPFRQAFSDLASFVLKPIQSLL